MAPAWDFPSINHALDITNEETFVVTPGVSLTGVKDLLSRGDSEQLNLRWHPLAISGPPFPLELV